MLTLYNFVATINSGGQLNFVTAAITAVLAYIAFRKNQIYTAYGYMAICLINASFGILVAILSIISTRV